MSDDIFHATYSHSDAAGALRHQSFGDFRRNLKRDDLLNVPQETNQEYGYGNILEMALHIPVASRYSRDIAKAFCSAVFAHLSRKALKKLDQGCTDLAEETRTKMYYRSEDFPGHLNNPAISAATAPMLLFNEDMISRDLENRTWAIFLPHSVANNSETTLTIVNEKDGDADGQGLTLADVRARAYEMSTHGLTNEYDKHIMGYEAVGPGLIDLTSIVIDMDRRLNLRFGSRRIGLH